MGIVSLKFNKMITEMLAEARRQQKPEHRLKEIKMLEGIRELIEELSYAQIDELVKMLSEIHLTTIVQTAERRWNEETVTRQSPTT